LELELEEAEDEVRLYDLRQKMKEVKFSMRKQMFENHIKGILRVTICFKNIGLFEANDR
jgi:hypothetical protein